MTSGTTVVVLAAGKGTRMKSARPKVLHPLCGRPLLAWVLDQAASLDPDRVVLVVGADAEQVSEAARKMAGSCGLGGLEVVVQEPQRGTGHALQVAMPAIGACERVVVLYGDMPLLRSETLARLVGAQREAGGRGMSLLTSRPPEARGFGRIVRSADGAFDSIVEERDADARQRAIREVNVGVYCLDRAALDADLPRLSDQNAQGELYLTDLPAMAVADRRPVVTVELLEHDEGLGVNTLRQLSDVRAELQQRILEGHLAAGVLIEDPASALIDHGVEIGPGTHILPFTVLRAGVKVGAGCEVGPFTHLRTGTVLEDGAQVGNFTECKNSTLGRGSKAKHLSYLGDTKVGEKTNIGAGTIFANYDGKKKHLTQVGDRVFIGSGTIVVAPNALPDGSTTGAGAVVTRSAKIAPGETFVGMPARKLGSKPADPRPPREEEEE